MQREQVWYGPTEKLKEPEAWALPSWLDQVPVPMDHCGSRTKHLPGLSNSQDMKTMNNPRSGCPETAGQSLEARLPCEVVAEREKV
jgi:hypothetical protein